MTQVERDGAGFVVPAILLAEAFGLTESDVRRVDAHRCPDIDLRGRGGDGRGTLAPDVPLH